MNQHTDPWLNEPNTEVWVDPHTGLLCAIARHPEMGHLCGYVGVHPVCKNRSFEYATVHGGVTYDGEGPGSFDELIPEEFSDLRWIGFDCAHSGDLIPKMPMSIRGCTYRTWDYVKAETASLARQVFDSIHPLEFLAGQAEDVTAND